MTSHKSERQFIDDGCNWIHHHVSIHLTIRSIQMKVNILVHRKFHIWLAYYRNQVNEYKIRIILLRIFRTAVLSDLQIAILYDMQM